VREELGCNMTGIYVVRMVVWFMLTYVRGPPPHYQLCFTVCDMTGTSGTVSSSCIFYPSDWS